MVHQMTREEHLKMCKQRAIQEYDFYIKTDGHEAAARNGLVSMASDMGKHPETNSPATAALCIFQKPRTRQEFVNFINGFN